MKYTAMCLAAFAVGTQAVSSTIMGQLASKEERWEFDDQACDGCDCGAGKIECDIWTCPDGNYRNSRCECPGQEPEACTKKACWDGSTPDKYCMCKPEKVCPINVCPDGKPRDKDCKCDIKITDCDWTIPCWDFFEKDEYCMCTKKPAWIDHEPYDAKIICKAYNPRDNKIVKSTCDNMIDSDMSTYMTSENTPKVSVKINNKKDPNHDYFVGFGIRNGPKSLDFDPTYVGVNGVFGETNEPDDLQYKPEWFDNEMEVYFKLPTPIIAAGHHVFRFLNEREGAKIVQVAEIIGFDQAEWDAIEAEPGVHIFENVA